MNNFFLDESFVTVEYLQNIIGVKCNLLEHANIKSKIMKLRVKLNINNVPPILPDKLKIIQMSGKGCQTIYTTIQTKSDNIILTLKEKWEQMLNDDIFEDDIFRTLLKSHKNLLNVYITDMYNLRYCMID